MSIFESRKVQAILNLLVKKQVLFSKHGNYKVKPAFDLIVRGRIIRKLDGKHPKLTETIVLDAVIETLAEYDVFTEEGPSFDNQLIVRTLLTFAKDKFMNQIERKGV